MDPDANIIEQAQIFERSLHLGVGRKRLRELQAAYGEWIRRGGFQASAEARRRLASACGVSAAQVGA